MILESTSDEKIKQRAHLRFVKLCQPISNSILHDLRPEQRQLLGYHDEIDEPDNLSHPFTQSSEENTTTDSESSTEEQTHRIPKSNTVRRRRHHSSSVHPDDSVSQQGSQGAVQAEKPKKTKNIFKRMFNFMQNKTHSIITSNQPILEKSGSFRLGTFRPANKSTPMPPLRRSNRLKNLDKIDYNVFHKTGKKKMPTWSLKKCDTIKNFLIETEQILISFVNNF